MKQSEAGRLQAKDLINVGVFTALYFAVFFVCGMLGYIPVLMLAIPFVCPFVAGIPFMLYLTKVKKFGMITITGLICGILMLVTGMSWQGIVTGVAFALVAEVILKISAYKSAKMSVLAYGVFSVWLIGMMFPLFFLKDAYIEALRPTYGNEYADTLSSLTPLWVFYVLTALSFVGGVAGGLLGRSVLGKHFKRAGIA